MSSMLEQAIIDAKLLQEAAQKRAEQNILDLYEKEIRQNINILLEQEDMMGTGDVSATPNLEAEPDMSLGDDISLDGGEATPETKKVVDNIPAAYLDGDNSQEIEINLDSIVQKIDSMQKDLNMMSMPDLSVPAHVVPQSNPTMIATDTIAENAEVTEEGEDLDEEVVEEDEQLEEEMKVDMSNVSAGGLHANEIELKRQHDIARALMAQNAELQEQLKARYEEFSALEEKLSSVFTSLKETKN